MKLIPAFLCFLAALLPAFGESTLDAPLTFGATDNADAPHVVLIAGDEEYRSEEALPQLAKILGAQHNFRCTVLFSVNAKGEIDPKAVTNIDHPDVIDSADLLILSLRFREWPDEHMAKFVAAMERGVPVIGMRTTTHAFRYREGNDSAFTRYHFKSKDWEGGFGRQILGETWVSHYGKHNVEGTLAKVREDAKDHPILRGVGDIFGKTDVYGATPMADSTPLMDGYITETLEADSAIKSGEENETPQPIAWTRALTTRSGDVQRIFTTTMGSSQDYLDEDMRRLVVNAAYWCLDMEVPQQANVDIVGDYEPTHFGVDKHVAGVRPGDLK